MDRDSLFGLTEEDYGYDDDDEAFEQYGLFTSSAMFSGAGYRGYSGADVVTKPSMAAAYGQQNVGMGGASEPSSGYMTPEMALEQAAMAHEEAEWAAEDLQGAQLVSLDGQAGAFGTDGATATSSVPGAASLRDATGMSEEDYWGDEDEQALLFGFGEF